MDQSRGQPKFLTHALFNLRHLSMVRFVIVARQVQNPMQSEDFDFLGGGMPETAGVCGGNLT